MDFVKHISNLLYITDRVVVPGFGVFSLKYIPAKIHSAKQTFEPPAKELLFTSAVKDDNGLLIRHIAEKEGMKAEEVKLLLEKFVKECISELSKGKELKFEKLGKISRKADGTYIFKADRSVNYFNDTFGIESINTPEIIKTNPEKKVISRTKIKKPFSKKKKRKLVWYFGVLIPLIAIIIFGIMNYDLIRNKISGIFSKIEIAKQQAEKPKTQNDVSEEMSEEQQLFDTTLSDNEFTIGDFGEDTSNRINTEAIEDQDAISEQEIYEVQKKYYIVAGCFQSEKGAEKLLNKLKQKGYNSQIFGKTPKGLHMVSYDSYEDKKEANIALRKIMREENPSAWIIRY